MKLKKLIHHPALFMTLILTMILTVVTSVAADEASVKKAASGEVSSAQLAEDGISGQIIMNATHYLQLTSCEGMDEQPVIQEASAPVPRTVIPVSDDDIYLMACQVYVEAGAEPYDGMVGVADVIINRVKSSEFPDTVEGVIYQSGQFPPAHNGVLSHVLAQGPGDTCMQATLDALYGASTVGDYLYFNMSAGVNTSAVSRYMQIGDTVFYMP